MTVGDFVVNQCSSVIGNVIAGAILVGTVYAMVFVRRPPPSVGPTKKGIVFGSADPLCDKTKWKRFVV